MVRGGYGIYYDQPLVGIFLQNAVVNPPLVSQPSVLNARLSDPGAGEAPTTRAPLGLIATSDPFAAARTLQWNVGVQRRLYPRGVIDVGYVGSAGDHLIQPVDINQPQPQDVVALGLREPCASLPRLRGDQLPSDHGPGALPRPACSGFGTTAAAREP